MKSTAELLREAVSSGLVGRGHAEAPQIKLEVIRGLLKMRREGFFRAVYCDGDKLRVVAATAPDNSQREPMSWSRAETLVAWYEKGRGEAKELPLRVNGSAKYGWAKKAGA